MLVLGQNHEKYASMLHHNRHLWEGMNDYEHEYYCRRQWLAVPGILVH